MSENIGPPRDTIRRTTLQKPQAELFQSFLITFSRTWCRLIHWRHRVPHNGFGWTGFACGKCGWMFFGEWDHDRDEERLDGKT